ncbi:MAG: hypothetical protein QM820_06870 [Minicystis sp.]
MIIGGIAVIARGVPRLTRDIDATIAGGGTDLSRLVAVLRRHEIVPRIEDAVRFAQQNHVLLLRHAPTGVDVDLSLAWLPFELEALAASDVVSIHGARVPVARAEDLVIYKIAAWRPQDQQDVERLIALHGEHMDLARVRAAVRELATTLDEPQRIEEFERVVARARALLGGTADPKSKEVKARAARKQVSSGRATPAAGPNKKRKPSSRVAAQQAAAPDGGSSRAARGKTRRG